MSKLYFCYRLASDNRSRTISVMSDSTVADLLYRIAGKHNLTIEELTLYANRNLISQQICSLDNPVTFLYKILGSSCLVIRVSADQEIDPLSYRLSSRSCIIDNCCQPVVYFCHFCSRGYKDCTYCSDHFEKNHSNRNTKWHVPYTEREFQYINRILASNLASRSIESQKAEAAINYRRNLFLSVSSTGCLEPGLQFNEVSQISDPVSIISFLGKTGNGKSFILRSILDHLDNGDNGDNNQSIEQSSNSIFAKNYPFVGIASSSSTTSDLSAYIRDQTVYLDSEGLYGTEIPIQKEKVVDKLLKFFTDPLDRQAEVKRLEQLRRRAVYLAYTSIIYSISDVVCYPHVESISAVDSYVDILSTVGQLACSKVRNPFKPALCLIFNKCRDRDFDETAKWKYNHPEHFARLSHYYNEIRIVKLGHLDDSPPQCIKQLVNLRAVINELSIKSRLLRKSLAMRQNGQSICDLVKIIGSLRQSDQRANQFNNLDLSELLSDYNSQAIDYTTNHGDEERAKRITNLWNFLSLCYNLSVFEIGSLIARHLLSLDSRLKRNNDQNQKDSENGWLKTFMSMDLFRQLDRKCHARTTFIDDEVTVETSCSLSFVEHGNYHRSVDYQIKPCSDNTWLSLFTDNKMPKPVVWNGHFEHHGKHTPGLSFQPRLIDIEQWPQLCQICLRDDTSVKLQRTEQSCRCVDHLDY